MKILFFNPKTQEIKLQPDNYEDIALLFRILRKGDFLLGKARRKVELNKEGERSRAKIEIINAFIQIDKIKFQESSALHVEGILQDGEYKGKFQSISVEVGESYIIKKQKWQTWELDKIKQYEKITKPLLFIGVEQEELNFFVVGRQIKHIAKIKNTLPAKDFGQTKTKLSITEVFEKIQDLNKTYNFGSIIIFGPAFWKEMVAKELKAKKLQLKIFTEGASSGDEHGLFEIMRAGRISKIEKDQQFSKEFELWENFLEQVKLNGAVAYGLENIKKAIDQGAVETLLISDSYLRDKVFADLMQQAEEKSGAKIFIISQPRVKTQLDGFGGIVAFLRWKFEEFPDIAK